MSVERPATRAAAGKPTPPTLTAEERTMADAISTLLESTEILTKRVELEKRKAAELDKKILISQSKLDVSRGKLRGLVTDLSDGGLRVKQRQLTAAEHKLEVNVTRLNMQNKENEGIKRAIESLRRDKLQRLRVAQRLDRETAEAHANADKAQSEAAVTLAAKDKLEKDIAAIQAAMTREELQYEQEYESRIAEFERNLEQRKKAAAEEQAILGSLGAARQGAPAVAGTGTLMSVLGESTGAFAALSSSASGLLETDRSSSGTGGGGAASSSTSALLATTTAAANAGLNRRAAAAAAAAAAAQEAMENTTGDLTVEQEIELKHRSSKILWEIAKREVEVRNQSSKLAVLEDAFAKIRALTSITSVEEMVTAFLAAEEKEFSLLGMINDLNREIEKAEIENGALRAAVEKAKEKGDKGAKSRRALYDSWDAKLKALAAKEARYNARYESALRTLDSIKPGVQAILNKVGQAGAGGIAGGIASSAGGDMGGDDLSLTLPSFIRPAAPLSGPNADANAEGGATGPASSRAADAAAAAAAAAGSIAASAGMAGALGGNGVVTDSNVVYCLATIERRVVDTMSLYDLSLQGIPLTLPIEEGELARVLQSAEDAGQSLTSNLGATGASAASAASAATDGASRRRKTAASRAAAGMSGEGGDNNEEGDEDEDEEDMASPLEGISAPLPHLAGKRTSNAAAPGEGVPMIAGIRHALPTIPTGAASSSASATSGLGSARSTGEPKRASTASAMIGKGVGPKRASVTSPNPAHKSIVPPSIGDLGDDDDDDYALLAERSSSGSHHMPRSAGATGAHRAGGGVGAHRRHRLSTGTNTGGGKASLIEDLEGSGGAGSLFLTSVHEEGKDDIDSPTAASADVARVGFSGGAAAARRARVPSAPAATSGGGGAGTRNRITLPRSPLK